jgi:hypothetical protein
LNNCMSNARTMVGVIKGNTDASYDANEREMHDGKKKEKRRQQSRKKYTYGGEARRYLLSSVIGKIWMHQGAFCRDPLGTVVFECLLKNEEATIQPTDGKVRGIKDLRRYLE